MKVNTKNLKWFVLLALIVVGFFVYFNSFSNKLFWDDDDGIVNNIYIKDFSYFPKYFSENLIAGSGQATNYWRPFVLTSFAIDYHLFGLTPAGYHVANLLWHIAAAWLAFLVLYRLSRKVWLSILPAFLFLIHPLQTEAVTYVSGRADPMSAVFTLAAVLFYILLRQEKKKIYFWTSLVLFLSALLCKEQSIMTPALIGLVELSFFFKKDQWKESLKLFFPYVLIAVIYFIARITFLNFNDILSGVDYSGIYDSSLEVRLLTFTYVFVKYISLLFAPFNLHMAYEITPITSIFDPIVWIFMVMAGVMVFICLKYFQKNRLAIFGLMWFLVLLLPRTNIISINRPLYEHWLYLPMLGFWLAIFAFSEKLYSKKELRIVLIVIMSLVSVYFGVLSMKRNLDWRDPITFYGKNLRYTPNSFIQHNNLGMAYADAGRLDEAIKEYQEAISIKDVYPQVHYNLGNALVQTDRLEEAKLEYYQAIKISPEFILPYNQLILLALQKKDKEDLKLVIDEMKLNLPERLYLDQSFLAYYYMGDYDNARKTGLELTDKYTDTGKVGLLMLQMR